MKLKSLIAVLLMCSMSAYAAKVVWTGNANDWDWNEEGNFQGGSKPVAGDVVEIPSGKVAKLKDKASVDLVASLSQLHVAEGAVFFTYDSGLTTIKGLYGAGLITNEVTQSYNNLKITGVSDFSGRIAGRIYYLAQGKVMLTGIDNVFAEPFSICSTSTGLRDFEELTQRNIGYTGVMKIGKKGESSSVGVDNDIRTIDYGGGLLYLGSGETTDRSFSVLRPNKGLSFIDGGATGGLVWEGDIILSGNNDNNGMGILGLIGSNSVPCVVAGSVKPRTVGSETYNFFFEKAGTGTWRFADTPDNKAQRNFFTSMAIKNGTLQFDSMEEAGTPCALGLATNLTALYYGARNDAAHPGPYAYWLGAPGKLPVFEYVGNKDICVSTRPIALEGDAKLKNNTDRHWHFSGISSTSEGPKNLYLAGNGEADNEISGIKDSSARPISIVKEGSGLWMLNGSNTFSGSVTVKAGVLAVKRDLPYTWFRWTIKEKMADTAAKMYLTEFALYDKDGKRLNKNLTFTENFNRIQPGQISFDRAGKQGTYSVGTGNRSLDSLTDGTSTPCEFGYYKPGTTTFQTPKIDNPDTWIRFVMRIQDYTTPVKYADVCIHYQYPASSDNRKANPATWDVEGSTDGCHWEKLWSVENLQPKETSYVWANSNIRYLNTEETESGKSGYDLSDSYPDFRPSTNFTNTVSVAAGATLKAIGEVFLSSMEIDAADFGTVDGFSFAASGELNVKNLPADGSLGGVFANAKGIANLKNWAFTVDGAAVPGKKIAVSPSGAVSVIPRGFALTVR